ncbi:MAG: GNAT family N-acetyltransferase [Candidatus Eisenbacteria bacterium]|nr:GNAT family N-acetyltransferase [Candidatus Eisenbacteria bacterium]
MTETPEPRASRCDRSTGLPKSANRHCIRRAGPADAPGLTQIAMAAKRHWGYPASYIQLWRDELTFTPAFISRNEVFVACRDGQIVGVSALILHVPRGELEHLWVRPAWIGRGVGRQLFRHAARRAQACGCTHLEIVADPFSEGFYLRMGAERVGSVPQRPLGRRIPLLRYHISPVTDPEEPHEPR